MISTALSKTSHVIENGERLKNFSWRLWNRETLCGAHQKPKRAQNQHNVKLPSIPPTVPELSNSVESGSSHDVHERSRSSSTLKASKERHITPLDLKGLVHSIKETRKLEPLQPLRITQQSLPVKAMSPLSDLPQPCTPRHPATESSTSTVATATDSFTSTGRKSDTSVSSSGSTHSIIRGFTPGPQGISTYSSNYKLAPRQPQLVQKSPPSTAAYSKKKASAMFTLGCSSGSGASGEEESLKDRMASKVGSVASDKPSYPPKKQLSFKENCASVLNKTQVSQDEAVFDDSDEDSETDEDESAIEEDDDAWEDEGEGSDSQEPEPEKDMTFYRIDSKANLPSRRSALTLNIEDQRNGTKRGVISAPAFRRSRTSTPNGPSMPGSPEQDSQLEQRAQLMSKSKPIIQTTGNTQPPAPLTSPRTTRRNMLAGELSESLRKNMLSERQQKNPLKIDSNQMKRAHTAHDVSRLKELTEAYEGQSLDARTVIRKTDERNVMWNQYFENSIGDINQAGW